MGKLAEAILAKQGVSKEASEGKPGNVAFETAADELYQALESKDKGAFRKTLRTMLDIEKTEGGG